MAGLTRANRRSTLYKMGLQLGFARTATAIANGQAVTDSNVFSDTGAGEGDYTGCYIYIPLEVAANQIRKATVVSGSGLLQGGDAYSGVASLAYEVVGMHPDELNECLRRSLKRIYFETYAPITPWTDGDFLSASATTPYDWTAVASVSTITKDATAANNQTGFNSLVVTNAGYTLTSKFNVSPGDNFVHGFSSRVTVAGKTAKYSLLDVTNGNVLIGTAVSHSSLAFQHFKRMDMVPSGCYQIQAKLETVGASGVSVWDYTFGHLAGRETGQIQLPSWLGEKWRLIDFGPAEYGRQTGTTSAAANLYNGTSRRWDAWRDSIDYELYPMAEEAAAYTLQINRPGGLQGTQDFWVHGLRPYSDTVTPESETTTTLAPEDLVTAGDLFEVAQALYVKTEDGKWLSLMQRAQLDLDAQRVSRRQSAPRRQPSVYVVGGRGGMSWGGRGGRW